MIKLVAIDMDGTLLKDDKTISQNTKDIILKARKNGVKIVLATGRPMEGLKSTLEFLELDSEEDFVLCFNGALVENVKTKEVIGQVTIKGEHLHELYKLSQTLGTNIHAFSSTKGLIAPKMSKYTQVEMDINNIPIQLMDFNSIEANEDIIKVMLIDEPAIIDKAVANLPKDLYDKYTIVRSTPYFLEFLSKKVNKGVGLQILAEYLNIKPIEIMSFGDAGNDIHMIEYAGLGVAMANATNEVKQASQFVTKSNNEDGVAHAMKQFSLDTIKLLKKKII
ncbi:HAD family hydrolase [Candidatus Epulonipiscioides gigas]|nr:HAD family hydrolase [Epulopiscium sp. SCG-C07WGA-EpuloA2]